MRIASVSDLHVDFGPNREALVRLATEIHREGADLVIVAGDVSHVDDHIARSLRAFRLAAPRVAYLPGNHDLWFAKDDAADDPEADSLRRYHKDLKALVEAEDCHYLPSGPLEMGTLAVAGTTGWYDYSLLRPELRQQVEDAEAKARAMAERAWADVRYAVFRDPTGRRMTDLEVARAMERELAAQLEDLDGNPEIEEVLVATHVLAFKEALGPSRGLPWDFFDAYMGSTRLGEIIRGSKKVRASVFGHTHRGSAFEIDQIRVHGTPLGYPRERKNVDPADLPAHAIGWLELGPPSPAS